MCGYMLFAKAPAEGSDEWWEYHEEFWSLSSPGLLLPVLLALLAILTLRYRWTAPITKSVAAGMILGFLLAPVGFGRRCILAGLVAGLLVGTTIVIFKARSKHRAASTPTDTFGK